MRWVKLGTVSILAGTTHVGFQSRKTTSVLGFWVILTRVETTSARVLLPRSQLLLLAARVCSREECQSPTKSRHLSAVRDPTLVAHLETLLIGVFPHSLGTTANATAPTGSNQKTRRNVTKNRFSQLPRLTQFAGMMNVILLPTQSTSVW